MKFTVTDSGGCSNQEIFTGQTASCNGSAAATAVEQVTGPVPGPGPPGSGATVAGPLLTRLSENRKTWREGTAAAQISSYARKRSPLGTVFSFNLNEAASVVFQFTKTAAGRSSSGRCVAQTPRNRHKRPCTRTIIAGTLTLSGRAGANLVSFGGVISRHNKLTPGSYALRATANASGKSSATSTVRFTIAPR